MENKQDMNEEEEEFETALDTSEIVPSEYGLVWNKRFELKTKSISNIDLPLNNIGVYCFQTRMLSHISLMGS